LGSTSTDASLAGAEQRFVISSTSMSALFGSNPITFSASQWHSNRAFID
jgi:hypothetical protein